MGSKYTYTSKALGKLKIVRDFLPSPAELAFREEDIKVTLVLSKKSVEFFKAEAKTYNTPYQRMIRRLLDAYVDAQTPARRAAKRRGA